MSKKSIFLERWSYLMPDTEPNPDGRIVLIKKRSFGPLEAYDWGIDVNGLPYEEYQWDENDLYEYENYFKYISKEELTEQIENLINEFMEKGFYEWANTYKKILNRLDSQLSG